MPRRKPFSVKQKKKQLQKRRLRKQGQQYDGSDSESASDEEAVNAGQAAASAVPEPVQGPHSKASVAKLNQQPVATPNRRLDPNRFRLHFFRESDEELHDRKKQCRKPLTLLPEDALETDIDGIYKPGTVLDIPKRPEWNTSMTKEALEIREDTYFQTYLDNIFAVYGPKDLSFFDMNLETWRQLWRVSEMSDILLLITDIRHPALHFSPALYDHITQDLNKPMILVLNKIDLAPLGLVVAWRDYFQKRFPKLHIVYFTSYAEATKDQGTTGLNKGQQKGRRIKSVGSKELLEACENIVKSQVDLSSWRSKVEGNERDVDETLAQETYSEQKADNPRSTYSLQHERYRDGIVTIGCVGYPNVGKSSLINGLMGKKVVSVSKTPGHTKHFQTIFLTPTVKLCDCPGLVFPSLIEKPLQILAGVYPIAQVREPYSCVAYLASRIDLPSILKLTHPKARLSPNKAVRWTAFDICNEWAVKCGYNTARGARPDMYRAANHILRLSVEGRLRLNFSPPGYTAGKETWRQHPEVMTLLKQGQKVIRAHKKELDELSSDSENEEPATARPETSSEEDEICSANPFSMLSDD